MTRTVPEWIGRTDDERPPPRVRARVFAAFNGICQLTGRKIRPGDTWELHHAKALINGGENRETNLVPALTDAHREQTKADVAEKAVIARKRAKHLGIWPKTQFPIRSRGFPKGRNASFAERDPDT